MVLFGVSPLEPTKVPISRNSRTKNLIMKAWRERWTDVQWGIHVRSLIDNDADTAFIADCILQQALNGPGPNSLVLSYLMHSFYSQIISAAAVLKSISLYDGYHKPFCVGSLLDLLDNIKSRLVVCNSEDDEECMQLALAVQSVVHWLLACMYTSLEKMSDLPASEITIEDEDTKIVVRCRNLLEYYLKDPYLSSLLNVAILEDSKCFDSIKVMCGDVAKLSEGQHGENIKEIIRMISHLPLYRETNLDAGNSVLPEAMDGLQMIPLNGTIQAIVLTAALFRSSKNLPEVAMDLKIVKELQGITNVDFYSEIIHSSMLGLIDAVGTNHELKFIGFVFLQLPSLLRILRKQLEDYTDSIAMGIDTYICNESALDIVDAKLHCYTLDLLLTSLVKVGLVDEMQKTSLLTKKGPSKATQKPNSSNAVLIMKAESTLASVLKTLDGDYGKNQEAILGVLYEMLGTRFELILTAASTTGTMQQVTSRLIKLNQYSRKPNGEGSKGFSTRAMIFDISFLMLCRTLQIHGPQAVEFDEPDCFFEEWYQNCMIEDGVARNPENIVSRCDQSKVEILLSQYLQGETEIKIGSIFWHELCTNAVGAMQNLLLAWENGAASFSDVKKIMDVFRSKMCCLPVCISAWLCSYIQITPEEQCGKARYILDYFLKPVITEENQDQYKERSAMMSAVISKMISSSQSVTSQAISSVKEDKPTSELLQSCWNSVSSKGLLDVETASSLKTLMTTCGHSSFIQLLLHEIFQQQYSMNLAQWCNIGFGIFLMDLKNCAESCLGHVLPELLKFSLSSQYFVEPQLIALVTLIVNTITSYYLHAKSDLQPEPMDTQDDAEPSSKRRKIFHQKKDDNEVCSATILESLLKDLFVEFEKLVCENNEASPQVVFVLRFLQQMSVKSQDLNLLHSCSDRLVMQLMNLMPNSMTTKLLVSLYNLSVSATRKKCTHAICTLQSIQSSSM